MNFNELFPDRRETGESKLRQSQLVMLRLLKIFDYLCDKHNIEYFLIGGSLLGAIRHNGFIPWDDDLDVGMTSENYSKFAELAAHELPEDIFFQNCDTDPFYRKTDPVDARLRDKYSSYRRENGKTNPWHEGLQLDIFVFHKSYLPSKLFIILENLLFNKIRKEPDKRAAILQKIEQMNLPGLIYGNNWSQSLGMIKLGANYIKPNEIQHLQKIKFEDMEAFIPKGYDSCLKRQYGDYMKLPPEDKRRSHHEVIAEPFIACKHKETLEWKEKQKNRV